MRIRRRRARAVKKRAQPSTPIKEMFQMAKVTHKGWKSTRGMLARAKIEDMVQSLAKKPHSGKELLATMEDYYKRHRPLLFGRVIAFFGSRMLVEDTTATKTGALEP